MSIWRIWIFWAVAPFVSIDVGDFLFLQLCGLVSVMLHLANNPFTPIMAFCQIRFHLLSKVL